jgi:hypothetical protein
VCFLVLFFSNHELTQAYVARIFVAKLLGGWLGKVSEGMLRCLLSRSNTVAGGQGKSRAIYFGRSQTDSAAWAARAFQEALLYCC